MGRHLPERASGSPGDCRLNEEFGPHEVHAGSKAVYRQTTTIWWRRSGTPRAALGHRHGYLRDGTLHFRDETSRRPPCLLAASLSAPARAPRGHVNVPPRCRYGIGTGMHVTLQILMATTTRQGELYPLHSPSCNLFAQHCGNSVAFSILFYSVLFARFKCSDEAEHKS